MSSSLEARFRLGIADLDPAVDRYATEAVAAILTAAGEEAVSDVHLLPHEQGTGRLTMYWRIDGVLHEIAVLERGPNIIGRLKVLSELLTYRTDIPQEGRIRTGDERVEMRVSTFPTIHGEKAVVRLFVGSGRYRELAELGLPDDLRTAFERQLNATSGAIIVAGPAGSGGDTSAPPRLRPRVRGRARRRHRRRTAADLHRHDHPGERLAVGAGDRVRDVGFPVPLLPAGVADAEEAAGGVRRQAADRLEGLSADADPSAGVQGG
jgi:hypothetical protein